MKDYGLPVSVALHVLVLAGALSCCRRRQPFAPPEESLPVEIVHAGAVRRDHQGREDRQARAEAADQGRQGRRGQARGRSDAEVQARGRRRAAAAAAARPRAGAASRRSRWPSPIRPRPSRRQARAGEAAGAAEAGRAAEARSRQGRAEAVPKPDTKSSTTRPQGAAGGAAEAEPPKRAAESRSRKATKPEKTSPRPRTRSRSSEAADKPAKPTPARRAARTFNSSKIAALLSKEAPAAGGAQRRADRGDGLARLGTRPRRSSRLSSDGDRRGDQEPCHPAGARLLRRGREGCGADQVSNLNADGTLVGRSAGHQICANAGGAAAAGAAMRAIKRCVTAGRRSNFRQPLCLLEGDRIELRPQPDGRVGLTLRTLGSNRDISLSLAHSD